METALLVGCVGWNPSRVQSNVGGFDCGPSRLTGIKFWIPLVREDRVLLEWLPDAANSRLDYYFSELRDVAVHTVSL